MNIEIRNDLIDCSIDVCALEASLSVVLVFFLTEALIQCFSRYCLYSRTTLITAILDGTLCTAFSLRIYSRRTYTVTSQKRVTRLASRIHGVMTP